LYIVVLCLSSTILGE